MTARTLIHSAIAGVMAIGASLGAPALAQTELRATAAPVAEPIAPVITVVAPRITHERDRTGGRLEVAKQTAIVDFSDLDLNRTNDLFVLEERIEAAAKSVCNELEDLYPHGRPSTDVCTRRAIEDAMAQAREVVRLEAAVAAAED